jgi:hypothetical protein
VPKINMLNVTNKRKVEYTLSTGLCEKCNGMTDFISNSGTGDFVRAKQKCRGCGHTFERTYMPAEFVQ